MSEQPKMCEKCGCDMTTLEGGLSCCPKCGFEGDKQRPDTKKSFSSQTVFWLALLSPATLALISFLMGRISDKMAAAAVMVGFAGVAVCAITSIYCGLWLAFRFSNNSGGRFLIGLFFIPAIAAVNLFIIVAGCASNLNFH